MRWPLLVVAFALVANTGGARGDDPSKSTACLQSLEALRVQEAVAIAANQRRSVSAVVGARPLETLDALRRQAAKACLGSPLGASRPTQRFARQPVAVASVAPPPAAWAGVPPGPTVAPPPFPVSPLRTITACDPTGCWASDGTHLLRFGSILVGPLGLCTVMGPVLSCP